MQGAPFEVSLAQQAAHTQSDFWTRLAKVVLQLNEHGFNAGLYTQLGRREVRSHVSLIPTSAHTGEGLPDLLFWVAHLSQLVLARTLAQAAEADDDVEALAMEVRKTEGHGVTVDVILRRGTLRLGQTVVMCGIDGVISAPIRALLLPEPLRDTRARATRLHACASVTAAHGVKIAAQGLDKALPGLPVMVAATREAEAACRARLEPLVAEALASLQTVDHGIHVQASTLGSLEGALAELAERHIPVASLGLGPVCLKDVRRAAIQLEAAAAARPVECLATVLAFDVPVNRDAMALAAQRGLTVLSDAHLFNLLDQYAAHRHAVGERLRAQMAPYAVFPCRLRVLPDHVYHAANPLVLGVLVEDGVCRVGTPLVTRGGTVQLGIVTSIQVNNQAVEQGARGARVCIKVDAPAGQAVAFGRHFDADDLLVSRLSRDSIDVLKAYFRDQLSIADWKLVVELKRTLGIL